MTQIDLKTMKTLKTVAITGLTGKVVGIDVRPADGLLYALAEDGTVATIDPATGKASVKTRLETMLTKGVEATVDFNPVADRLRVIGSDGVSLRANVDDGKVVVDTRLNFKPDDKNASKTPKVIAGAYANSVKGTKETALYDIDASGLYLKQAPPNDGILNTLGETGVSGMVAFDIATDAAGVNQGWLVQGKTVFMLDPATGKATKAGMVPNLKGNARDIAVLGT